MDMLTTNLRIEELVLERKFKTSLLLESQRKQVRHTK